MNLIYILIVFMFGMPSEFTAIPSLGWQSNNIVIKTGGNTGSFEYKDLHDFDTSKERGTGIEIHYWKNKNTGETGGFKFK